VSTIDRTGERVEGKRRIVRRVGLGAGGLVLLLATGASLHVARAAADFDESMARVRDVPVPSVARSADPAVLARGRHLVESVGACANATCHGADLGGGRTFTMGPLATLSGPNISGARLDAYSDGELARLLERGVKKDGRGVLFMPVQSFGWLPPPDIAAIVSYLRTVPEVDRPNGPLSVTVLGKLMDRMGRADLDVASRMEAEPAEAVPPAGPTAAYGELLGRACTMCHGEHLSGGPIPGAPSSMPVPLNLTPDTSGLREWSYEDFDRLMTTGLRRDGKKLDPFMPLDAFSRYDDVQKRALWAYLTSLPPRPFGQR
jgi:cytochrome c5